MKKSFVKQSSVGRLAVLATCVALAGVTSGCLLGSSAKTAETVEPTDEDTSEGEEPRSDTSTVADTTEEPPSEDTSTPEQPDTDRPAGGSNSGLHPRRVLYDGDGKAVKAKVEEIEYRPHPLDLAEGTEFSLEEQDQHMVRLSAIGDRLLKLHACYELKSGELTDCRDQVSHRRPVFTEEDCNGQIYGLFAYRHRVRRVYVYKGQGYWPNGRIKTLDGVRLYRAERDGSCQGGGQARGEYRLVPLEPVPDWISNALPNPPYEVKSAY